MAIDVKSQGISYAVGAVVVGLEYWDNKSARTGAFKTAADIGVAVGNLGGLALQMWAPKYAKLGETVALSTGPLLVKAIVRAVKPEWTFARNVSSKSSAAFVQRRVARPVGDNVTVPAFEGDRIY